MQRTKFAHSIVVQRCTVYYQSSTSPLPVYYQSSTRESLGLRKTVNRSNSAHKISKSTALFVLAFPPLSSPLHLRRDDRVSLCSAISPFRATLATRSASPRAFLPALPAPHSPRLNSTTMPPLILTMVRHGESMDNLRVSFIPQLVTCA